MSIHVLQGEREMAQRNRSLARFELTGIPPMTAGAARIRVAFAVDADGLVTVGAREETTGTESKVEVRTVLRPRRRRDRTDAVRQHGATRATTLRGACLPSRGSRPNA